MRTDRDPFLDCVHCGLCLSACPTYDELGTEMDSPRGRIYLLRAIAEGRLAWTGRVPDHIELCLGCLACETACPSGVRYRHLLEQARADLRRSVAPSLAERFLDRVVFARLFPYPRRLAAVLAAYQRTGLQRLMRRWGLTRWLPEQWRAMEALLPPHRPPRTPLPERTPARGPQVARVGLLTGCVQSVLFPEVHAATVRLLAASGCEVIVPPGQVCCGALSAHTGDLEAARNFARRNLEAFGAYDLDAIIVNAAGCGAALKDYATLLSEDPQAAAFSARVKDVTEFLAARWADHRPAFRSLPARVTYHDACHLAHGQRITAEPRQLLQAIPGLELVELPESDRCCGNAGIYSLVQPAMSQRLRQRKVKHLLSTGADLVVACNPGCLLQLRQGLEEAGSPMQPLHLVTLLDRAMNLAGEEPPRGHSPSPLENKPRPDEAR
jgi:glycolate oxidase iron-sulfur subunit